MGGPGAWELIVYFALPTAVEAIIVSLGVYLGVRFGLKHIFTRASVPGSETGNALEIARARYARGEISRKEYEQLRDDLEPGDPRIQKERAR